MNRIALPSLILTFSLVHLISTQAEEVILVSVAQDAPNWLNDGLYVLSLDGSQSNGFFDFSGQDRLKTGRFMGLRPSKDGKQLFFFSDHANIYTPAGRNVFQLDLGSKALDQVTPGPKSGEFGEKGTSTVSGFVRDGQNIGYVGAPVYLEGVGTVNTAAGGAFSFSDVPPGVRWLVAYNRTLDRFEAQTVNVVNGADATGMILTPNTNTRMQFERPVPFGERIYYTSNNGLELSWTTKDFNPPKTVYKSPGDLCTGIPTVDAFDISASGKIIVYDYQTGCGVGNRNHVGLYIMDKDGGDKKILRDMLNDAQYPQWDDPVLPVEIFWSPDESKIALKAGYANVDHVVVLNSNGDVLGYTATNSTTAVVTLHGWSPDGANLLFSEYNGNPALASLGKIAVDANGAVGAVSLLLNNTPISSACWVDLSED